MVHRVALHLETWVSDLLRSLWACTSYSKYILNDFTCLMSKIIVDNVNFCVCVLKKKALKVDLWHKLFHRSSIYNHCHYHYSGYMCIYININTSKHTHTCIDIPSDEESTYFSKAEYIFIKETNHNFDISHHRKVKCEGILNIYRFTLLYS